MKRRVTISIDDELLNDAIAAVASGRADSVSAWVNDAAADRAARDRRLAALAEMVASYEAEHGEITEEELAEQAVADRDAAAAVRQKAR